MTRANHIHPFTEWAKSRLDEINAALAVFEDRVESVATAARKKADATIADMKNHRDAFTAEVKEIRDRDEKSWTATNAKLEAEWTAFEDSIDAYWESVDDKANDQQAAFKARVEAQQKAWAQTAARIKADTKEFQSDRRADVDAALTKAEHIAQNAAAKLGNVNSTGKTSWSALRSALTESRAAFDTANSKAMTAFRAAMEKDKTT